MAIPNLIKIYYIRIYYEYAIKINHYAVGFIIILEMHQIHKILE